MLVCLRNKVKAVALLPSQRKDGRKLPQSKSNHHIGHFFLRSEHSKALLLVLKPTLTSWQHVIFMNLPHH